METGDFGQDAVIAFYFQEQLFKNMDFSKTKAKKYPKTFINQIWQQIDIKTTYDKKSVDRRISEIKKERNRLLQIQKGNALIVEEDVNDAGHSVIDIYLTDNAIQGLKGYGFDIDEKHIGHYSSSDKKITEYEVYKQAADYLKCHGITNEEIKEIKSRNQMLQMKRLGLYDKALSKAKKIDPNIETIFSIIAKSIKDLKAYQLIGETKAKKFIILETIVATKDNKLEDGTREIYKKFINS